MLAELGPGQWVGSSVIYWPGRSLHCSSKVSHAPPGWVVEEWHHKVWD